MNPLKRIFFILCALAVLLGSAFLAYQVLQPLGPDETPELAEGVDPLLDFAAQTQDGDDVYFSDFTQQPTVALFWTSWCGACKLSMDILEELYEQVGDEVHLMAVNLSTLGHREMILGWEFMEESDFSFESIYDINGEAARLYGVNAVPLTLFIGSDGGIHHRHVGVMSAEGMLDVIRQMG